MNDPATLLSNASQGMEFRTDNRVDSRELRVLEELGSDRPVTQRELARKVGIAVGLANAMLKRMAHQGWIEVRDLDTRRLAYTLTPKGGREKSRLAYQYFERTLDFYKQARYRVKHNLLKARQAGVKRVALYGINEVAEICYLTLRELDMELVLVSSPKHAGEQWLGLPVGAAADLLSRPVDAVVVTDFDPSPDRYPELKDLGIPVLWLEA